MNWDTAWATSMTRAHHQRRRGGGGESQDQPGHHLPPARLVAAQVLLDDEAQPHPAQDHRQCAGGDGPDHHPGLLDEGMQIGELRGSSGEDVASYVATLPGTRGTSVWAEIFSTTPHRVPWTPWITHLAAALAQRSGSRAPSTLVPQTPWAGGRESGRGRRGGRRRRCGARPAPGGYACSGWRSGCSSRAGYSKVYSQPSDRCFSPPLTR